MDPRALEIISTLLSRLNITVDKVIPEEGSVHTLVAVETPDAKALIGPRGEHLRAFNYIARRIAEQQLGENAAQFLVDVNGYHKDHIAEIQQKARMLADRVRSLKTRTELSPMNAYERMIIHAMFSGDPQVGTLSEGEGKDRRVVLVYREQPPETPAF